MASKGVSSLFSRIFTCLREVRTREMVAGKENPEVLSATQKVRWQGRNQRTEAEEETKCNRRLFRNNRY